MGKEWDKFKDWSKYQQFTYQWATECLRILKPGGYLLSFGGTRTYHRMTCAIEDAGFEIRNCICWLYASGFPKSLNIGKQVDKIQGNEREVMGIQILKGNAGVSCKEKGGTYVAGASFTGIKDIRITKGNSEWEGWGTALKPAFEPIVVARKPLSEKNVASNVLKWGTGGISISESRIISDKKCRFLDYVNKISANVFPLIGNNIAYKDQKNDAIALDRNFDKLFSFLVGDSYLLVGNEELYVQNHNYQKFSNFLDNCPVCFHLCDALVHLFASSDLISVQQLTDVHKYIHLFEQKDGQVVSPLHSREKYNGLPSNEDFFQKIEDQSVKKIYCDEEYHIYQEYLKLFHKNNHICLPSGLNQTKFPSGILDKSFFLHLLQTDNSNEFSCFLLKYLITFIITNTVHLVKEKINHQGRFPANLILDEESAKELDRQSGINRSKRAKISNKGSIWGKGNLEEDTRGHNDVGGASRFFYVAKASKRERDMGLEGIYTLKENTPPKIIEEIKKALDVS